MYMCCRVLLSDESLHGEISNVGGDYCVSIANMCKMMGFYKEGCTLSSLVLISKNGLGLL